MKILKMKLENFQGVKELEIDPQGESSAIYGDNGTGKSTVYNAFTWLMYGKPSTTKGTDAPALYSWRYAGKFSARAGTTDR